MKQKDLNDLYRGKTGLKNDKNWNLTSTHMERGYSEELLFYYIF
jgi:hypothetical protein